MSAACPRGKRAAIVRRYPACLLIHLPLRAFSKLDLCEGESVSSAIFNSDVQIKRLIFFEFYISVRLSLCRQRQRRQKIRTFFCLVDVKRRSFLTSCLFLFPCVQSFRVSIPPTVRPTLLQRIDMGSLTCAQIWVRAVHTKGDQAETSLHKS